MGEYLSKRKGFSKRAKSTTLIKRSIYMSFPDAFNDAFDSQIMLNNKTITKIASKLQQRLNHRYELQ
jgi:hypothetical protein